MFSLFDIIENDIQKIKIMDIGALPMKGQKEIYSGLIDAGRGSVIGFEPDDEACIRLNQEFGPENKYFPYAIFDGEPQKFYITNTGMTSSLYVPDHAVREKFFQLSEVAQVVRIIDIDTYKLDEIEELVDGIDYLKMDAQGAEYEILKHGGRVARSACVVHSEAHLIPVYKDQPLLADQDKILRQYGFQFHKFHSFLGRPMKPLMNKTHPMQPISQYTQTDIVYAKDFMKLDELSPEKLIKMAVILNDVYKSYDLCHVVLSAYDHVTADVLAQKYLDRLAGGST